MDVAALHAWQRHYGMEPREDSRLTELYARGELAPLGADEVARELYATDFFYRGTLYPEVIEAFLRRVAARLREEHSLSWTSTWKVVRYYGPLALKLLMVRACEAPIPEPAAPLPQAR